MPVERSAGAIIFREDKNGRKYLLLRHPDRINKRVTKPVKGHWDLPKGHVEKGEKTEDTVRREVKEETGIERIDFVSGFKETIRYFVGPKEERRLKFVALFLVSTKQRRIKISHEHQGYAWLYYDEAYKLATYPGTKKLLKNANEFLQTKST